MTNRCLISYSWKIRNERRQKLVKKLHSLFQAQTCIHAYTYIYTYQSLPFKYFIFRNFTNSQIHADSRAVSSHLLWMRVAGCSTNTAYVRVVKREKDINSCSSPSRWSTLTPRPITRVGYFSSISKNEKSFHFDKYNIFLI